MERGICVLILKAWRFSRLFLLLLLFFYIVFILCISFRPLFSLSFSLILSVGWLFSLFLLHFRHLLYIHIHFDLLGEGFFLGGYLGRRREGKSLGGFSLGVGFGHRGVSHQAFFVLHLLVIYIYIHLSISFHSSSSWAFILLPFHLLIG